MACAVCVLQCLQSMCWDRSPVRSLRRTQVGAVIGLPAGESAGLSFQIAIVSVWMGSWPVLFVCTVSAMPAVEVLG